MRRVLSIILLFAGISLITNCVHLQPLPMIYEDEQAEDFWPAKGLQDMFGKYWTLRSQGNYRRTFAMEAPYLQEIVPIAVYQSRVAGGKRKIERISLLRAEMESSRYWVIISTLHLVDTASGERIQVTVRDRWVKPGRRWYHVIKDPLMKRFFP